MMRIRTAALAVLMGGVAAFGEPNLVKDPGMEGKIGAPGGWETVMIGNPVEFAADKDVKHGGSQSMRIAASDTARAYFRSAPIAVGAGEKVKAGAWVKFKDVPEKGGTVILIAEWSGPDGRGNEVAKFDVA